MEKAHRLQSMVDEYTEKEKKFMKDRMIIEENTMLKLDKTR